VNYIENDRSKVILEDDMKAIVHQKYGLPDVLELKDVEKPSPKDGEVLIKVHAASVNSYDWRRMRAAPFVVRLDGRLLELKDIRLGANVAGRIEAVGSNDGCYPLNQTTEALRYFEEEHARGKVVITVEHNGK
jgi:threonine dehydrogenase-like Zn-dependent dehydrogenase